jgi:hypothetical protein
VRLTPALVRAGAALAAALVLLPAVPADSAPARARRGDTVLMTIDKLTPSTPVPSQTLKPLTVELTLTNTTDQPLSGVRIVGERGEPISSQPALDA